MVFSYNLKLYVPVHDLILHNTYNQVFDKVYQLTQRVALLGNVMIRLKPLFELQRTSDTIASW